MQAPVAVRCLWTNCYTLPLPFPLLLIVLEALGLSRHCQQKCDYVTMKGEYQTVPKLSNGTSLNHLE